MRLQILFFIILLSVLSGCNSSKQKYVANNGMIYGTYYSVKYESANGSDLGPEIDRELKRLSRIFSHYDKEATITKINNNTDIIPEPEFIACFQRAMEISELTNGAFDITAAPLISAWGFGPEDKQKMTAAKVDSLKQFCGYNKVKISSNKIVKDVPEIMLNMSAIAKGYTCDLIGDLLNKKGCVNYMVDIGGEVVASGVNSKGKTWTIGIRKPIENPFKNELNAALRLENKAMATSGNYLNFYEENGKKYAHTIDPKSGYPVQHSLLSASVVANDCMSADAFATAFMVLGKDLGIEIARQVPGLEIYFIYADESGENQVYMSEGFSSLLVN
ncbi:FAD:protein FMN transferase [uncultured Draconibacterium sp.]|uniref:FAD:protein FMN transferase n=1 Tax=uncultured Draconibacterium sp. TaxID=1573823 RepID=UPI0025D0B407|nr:FAD:protein FMN transferase [uncultured Draconibacterium sp.]